MKETFDPILQNQLVALHPLIDADFETMFSIAADPRFGNSTRIKPGGKKRCSAVFLIQA